MNRVCHVHTLLILTNDKHFLKTMDYGLSTKWMIYELDKWEKRDLEKSLQSEPPKKKRQIKERETDRETEGGRESCWRSYLDISFLLLVFTLSNCYYYFFWTWQMQKMKPIQVTYNHSFHTLYKWKSVL